MELGNKIIARTYDELIKVLADVMILNADDTVTINQTKLPAYIVQERFRSLDSSHMEYLVNALSENEALRNMKNEIELSSFSDLVYVDSEDLRAALGLDIDDESNFYDPLAKDLDNDGIADRYDNDFKDSDYFKSTYDVKDNLHTKEEVTQKTEDKPSILGQIRAYQNESKTEEKQTTKEQEYVR